MDACVIIGFSYQTTAVGSPDAKNNERSFIPGILIDIYHACRYARSLKCDTILIITDIIYDLGVNELRQFITNSTVNLDILHFISDIRHQYYLKDYTSKKQIIRDIRDTVLNKEKIFFYYTGHALNGNILLPFANEEVSYYYGKSTDSLISFSNIRDVLSLSTYKNAKILTILDCCNANGLDLPYKLFGKVYRLTSKSNKIYPQQKFLCFSSTMIDESSIASRGGSIFSHIFFKNLREYRSIGDLLVILSQECSRRYDQTVTVHSSYPNIKMVWRWLCFNDDINVKLNSVENYFIIKEKTE